MYFPPRRGFVQSSGSALDWDCEGVLANARAVQQVADGADLRVLLKGKHVALLCEPGAGPEAGSEAGSDAGLFEDAADGLGARVARISLGLCASSTPDEIRQVGRILTRLYDAIECQGMDAAQVQRLAAAAGVPVFDHLASADHPIARLADLLAGDSPRNVRRRLVLQGALLSAIR